MTQFQENARTDGLSPWVQQNDLRSTTTALFCIRIRRENLSFMSLVELIFIKVAG